MDEQASQINYNLIAIKEAEVEAQTARNLDSETKAYVTILEEQIESVGKQLEQRRIFNPLESRIILNPVVEMRRIAAKTHSHNKFPLPRMTREYSRPRKAAQHAQTEIQNIEYGLMQLPKGKTLDDLKPPKKVAECQVKPEMKNREIQVE